MSATLYVFPQPSSILPRVWATASGTDGAAQIGLQQGPLGTAAAKLSPKPFPKRNRLHLIPSVAEAPEEPAEPKPELAFYRKYTEGMLRQYLRLSMGYGRTPSLLGRELFRGKVTDYKLHSFDDAIIFVHDLKNCLAKLSPRHRALIDRIGLQGHTQDETAIRLAVSPRTVWLHYGNALDELTAILLERKLLEPALACQGADR